MPIFPKLDLKVDTKVSRKNSETTDNSKRDSHNVSTSEANRYDQHYQASNSGNVEKKSVTNTDESDRSSTNATTFIDKSYHNNIQVINSNFQSTFSGVSDQSSKPAIGASKRPAIKNRGYRTPVASPAPETKEVVSALELKPEILVSKMSAEMENWALNFCSGAFVLKTDAMSRAKHICDLFENQYGESWHCVVGSDFGNFARYEEDSYIHLKIANQRVIVYKTPDANEIIRLQDLLEQRLEFEELNKRLEKEKAELKEEKNALSTELQNLEIKIKSLFDQNEKFKQELNINARDGDNMTPLLRAARDNQASTVKALIDLGANLDLQDNANWTALTWAAWHSNTEICKMLLEAGADVNIRGMWGDTALTLAALRNNIELVKMLLAKGAQVNLANNDGNTALHLATYRGYVEVAKLLVGHGANINVKANDGHTPLKRALSNNQTKVANYLKSVGATV